MDVSLEDIQNMEQWLSALKTMGEENSKRCRQDAGQKTRRLHFESLAECACKLLKTLNPLIETVRDAAAPSSLARAIRAESKRLADEFKRKANAGEEAEGIAVQTEVRKWALRGQGGVSDFLEKVEMRNREKASEAMAAIDALSLLLRELGDEPLPTPSVDFQHLEQLFWCLTLAARHPRCFTASVCYLVDPEELADVLAAENRGPLLANFWHRVSRRKSSVPEDADFSQRVSVHLWLQTAAAVFEIIGEKAHSIILTSGTLAPLDSFA